MRRLITWCLASAFLAAAFAAPSAQTRNTPKPNYELAADWTSQKVGRLVFDTTVAPRWLETSDRFWYAYQTREGRKFYLVDPLKKAKTPLFDHAKMAATLTSITREPYDAQHLPFTTVKFVKKDAAFQFDVQVPRDADVELERGVLLDELQGRERQVLRVVRLARNRRQRRRHLRVIEERRLRFLERIDEVKLAPLARLIRVPEAVARLEPARRDGRVEHEPADFLRRPVCRELVIRLRRVARLRGWRCERGGEERGRETPRDEAAHKNGLLWEVGDIIAGIARSQAQDRGSDQDDVDDSAGDDGRDAGDRVAIVDTFRVARGDGAHGRQQRRKRDDGDEEADVGQQPGQDEDDERDAERVGMPAGRR